MAEKSEKKKQLQVKCVGIDLGTSTIKISYKKQKIKIPSIIGEPNPGFRGISPDQSWENNLIIELENGDEYYIGELARLQSVVRIPLAREGRVKSVENAKIAIDAALGVISESKEEYFIVATGVPVATGREDMERLSKSIVGQRKIKIKNDATGRVKEIKAKILAAPVLPEPYGSWYYVLKKEGETKALDSVIIDIGFGSTDYLTIYKGQILRTASGSIREAVDTLVTMLAQYITEKTGAMLKPESLIPVLESGEYKLSVAGKTFDITPQVEAFSRHIANVIVDELYRLLENIPPDAIIKYYILVGGGVYIFGDKIKEALKQRGIISDAKQLVIPEDPIMSNAMGFELIAKYYEEKLLKGRK